MLNLNQTPDELKALYGTADYYWYLRSPQYVNTFLKPIAEYVNNRGSCIDAGCGEALLGDLVTQRYHGFDGSVSAVERALRRNGELSVTVDRFEDPHCYGRFDITVFSGVMEVLILPEARVSLVELYMERFGIQEVIVCDLERLDTDPLQRRFGKPLVELHAVMRLGGVEAVKCKRKILVYKCV